MPFLYDEPWAPPVTFYWQYAISWNPEVYFIPPWFLDMLLLS